MAETCPSSLSASLKAGKEKVTGNLRVLKTENQSVVNKVSNKEKRGMKGRLCVKRRASYMAVTATSGEPTSI